MQITDGEEDTEAVPNNGTTKKSNNDKKDNESDDGGTPTTPSTKTHDRNKAGECNLLPVLVERLRSALEQSCSSQSTEEEQSNGLPLEDSGPDSEEDLRAWASGLCSSMKQQQQQLTEESQSPRGLKLDLKFLEDLLLSDIQTALGRLQEILKRVDIGTLTRYSSTLDPTNKLNLLKLISSLLANLKIPEESIDKPEKSAKPVTAILPRRRRTDRHTIGVSSEELARARKWLEEQKSSSTSPNVTPETLNLQKSQTQPDKPQPENSVTMQEHNSTGVKENGQERVEATIPDNQFDNVREKYMKDAINQQQSLQSKSKETEAYATSGKCHASYKDDNTIINEEYGISASSLYHQSNAQAKCNKFLAKKSKIKRANTIDIPNYLKLQAESLANSQGGCVSLRRPINIGDRYSSSFLNGNAIPSFEPKTDNDRKFLALINKNNETPITPPSTSLPFKSFNYRQVATIVDKNWNNRFSNIKTTFDKPQVASASNQEPQNFDSSRRKSQIPDLRNDPGVIVGSLRLPYNNGSVKTKSSGFSHAPTSPFQKIAKPTKEETLPSTLGFLKPGYLSKGGSTLQAKVKMFDQENVENLTAPPAPLRTKSKSSNVKRASNLFDNTDENSRVTENGHLNYHSFCKQFAPFAIKNPTENHKTNPWTNGNILNDNVNSTKSGFNKISAPYIAENNKSNAKVPVSYQAGERSEQPRNRKLYDELCKETNGNVNPRDVVAYPFEINYQKRPNFGKQLRESATEKGNYEDPEPLSSLQYIKSVLPSANNPAPAPRGIFSVQSVAVQTNQTEPPRPIYPKESRGSFDDERRSIKIRHHQPGESPRLPLGQYTDSSVANSFQSPVCQRESDAPANYPGQGRPQTASHVSYPATSNYPYYSTSSHQNSYGQIAPQVPLRSNPPQKVSTSHEQINDGFQRYPYDNELVNSQDRNYNPGFYRDNQNPIYVPPNISLEKFVDDTVGNELPASPVLQPVLSPIYNPSEVYHPPEDDIESADVSEDHSFVDDENIQNQDISSTEGVVTRYASAIATVSSESQSPVISPFSPSLKEYEERLPCVPPPNYRESEDLSLDEIRRHNLLQQNLIRQLQAEQAVPKIARRLSQEVVFRDERSGIGQTINYPSKVVEERRDSQTEPVIESNNTQDKINIFEGRNNVMRKQQQQQQSLKPLLSIPRSERETFLPPKINVVSPSKVFKPNFNADPGHPTIPARKIASQIDSSDEYLMSCANRPSRSIVLSKSESWHQLAMAKSTLQIPQTQPLSLLKPPKPKSPSSLRLSKQYEASSSTDQIKKMEEKIQRYFTGSSNSQPESPVAPRRENKSKRNLSSRKSQGSGLMRSHTMPHIYDETSDVEKAFDSLFKEATRTDNRY